MKKLFIILIAFCLGLNVSAAQKILPNVDTVNCFFYKHFEPSNEDTVILEPIAVPPGCALIGNWLDVGSTIYTHPHWDQCVNESCKTKYKRINPSPYCYIERVGNKIFVIFKGKGEEELYALLNYEKFILRNNSYLACLNK
jgi:hypothetical protein